METLEDFKKYLEKEYEVWQMQYDLEDSSNEKRLCVIEGRLRELSRLLEML